MTSRQVEILAEQWAQAEQARAAVWAAAVAATMAAQGMTSVEAELEVLRLVRAARPAHHESAP